MAFCSHCGKEVSEDVSFCPNCGERLKTISIGETHSGKKSKVGRFVIGLIVVGTICALLFAIEDLTIPHELRIQIGLAKMLGNPPPYDFWAPKAAIGLSSVYAVAGLIYFTFADR